MEMQQALVTVGVLLLVLYLLNGRIGYGVSYGAGAGKNNTGVGAGIGARAGAGVHFANLEGYGATTGAIDGKLSQGYFRG